MKIIVIGDPHLKIGSLQRTTVMIEKIVEKIEATSPDLIVCLGDVLDRFANIRQETLSQATDFFRKLQSYAPTVILIGNHDRTNNAVFCTDEHPFNAVKYWIAEPHPVTIVDTPITLTFNSNIHITFVPYVPDGRFMEALEFTPNWLNSKVIFAHQDFLGAKYGNQISTTGDEWNRKLPLVISGHIHDYQEIGKNIVYAGSPLQHAYDESPIKSLSMVTVDVKNIKQERIFLDVPILWTYRITYDEIQSYVPPNLPLHSEMKLVIQGTASEIKGLHKLTNVNEWRKKGIKIQPAIKIDTATKSLMQDSSSSHVKKPFIQLLRDYLEDFPDLLMLVG